MKDTRSLLRNVGLRLRLRDLLEDLQHSAAASACVLLVGCGLDASGLVEVPFPWTAGAALSTLVGWPLIAAVLRPRTGRQVAAEADQALGLAERLSTALWCESDDRSAGPLSALVVQDARATASAIDARQLRGAFRPAVHRRPLGLAGIALLLAFGTTFLETGSASAGEGETETERVARLADETRIARVMQKLEEASERVEKQATTDGKVTVAGAAQRVRKVARSMRLAPPTPEEALRKLDELAGETRKAGRRAASVKDPEDAPEAAAQDRALREMLRQMAKAGMESLQEDLRELEKRLEEGEKGENPPSAEELRSMADRIQALREAMKQAGDEAGAEAMAEQLRSIGNEDLMQEIAQRLQEMAAKLDQGADYEQLQSELGEQPLDMNEMTREELQELLDQLDQLQQMEDLAEMLSQGGREMAGGKRLRIGLGRGENGSGDGPGGMGQGQGQDGEGNGNGQGNGGQGNGNGTGGEGTGRGGVPPMGEVVAGARPEVHRGRLDPKGRILVTTFRGLPKPGERSAEFRAEVERVRDEMQAPLEAERIPRRYRDGIRDYFDDLVDPSRSSSDK